ncbi:hypothetical protein DEJ48_33690 [Streptomyces venezuelae]|uniref:DUF8017 domain-containing protein n=1 Tax=Streptomyces venezuelae TaxID=54571 RepID=A0A5P2C8Q2_STRVZ|nr:hypothetical protein [Streptomyces venezuelae]QES37711.1 hypothetical protein DEJ48_33690 [Streptomyces venezuelae]
MWHGEQPPGGEQGQHRQGRDQQEQNPYRQPGYQQPTPYGQQAPWNAPTMPGGPRGAAPEPPGGGRGGGDRTKLIALVAAGVVVVASGVTGALLLGGDKDDSAKPGPAKSSASPDPTATATATANPRTGDGMPEPTVPGWKVVVNPKLGIAFDVPADWSLESRDWAGGVVEDKDAEDDTAPFLAAYAAPAYFKEKWCVSDDDKDGIKEDTALAAAGTRGGRGVKSTEEAARHDAVNWVYGVYTQPDRKKVTMGPTETYTTESGLKGTLVRASSAGAKKRGTCGSDGKATVFAFKNSDGRFASWSFHGATGVKGELPDETVREITATVRLYEPVQD